jgi:hypothetical protein
MPKPQFVVKDNVPILDEHKLLDDDGEVLAVLDSAKLDRIARNMNRKARETGDLVPLVVGHTQDGLPERDQPEVVGYASNFRVKRFFSTGRKAIYCTFKFFRDKAHLARKFPRRSVELWLKKWEIDPISLLGASTPERALGLLQFSRGRGLHYSRTLGDKTVPMPEVDQVVQAVVAALKETKEWKLLESLSKKGPAPDEDQDVVPDTETEDLPPEEEDMPLPEEDEEPLPEDEDMPLEDDDPDPKKAQYMKNHQPVKKSAVASGTNTFTPGNDRLRMQRDQERIRKARYQRQVEDLTKETQTLRVRLARVEREKDLIQLESEGYQLDRAEELKAVEVLPDKAYQAHLARIRKRYQRAPFGGPIPTTETVQTSSGRGKDDVSKVVAYAQKKGLSYEDALAELSGKEKVF